jgi:protein-L-isoaspartate(D-aspartate) O-methyltransferase
MKHGDGWQGWQANAPYDGIIVTAAASEIPQALVEQLNDGGVLISPIGEHQQHLVAVKRQGKSFITQTLEEVRFVPLVAGAID